MSTTKELINWLGRQVKMAEEEECPNAAASLEAVAQHLKELEALAETLKNEAQIHAMEAKTANATINEINQFISGATGEPANWHGAKPVKDFVSDLKAQLEAAKKDVVRLEYLDSLATYSSRSFMGGTHHLEFTHDFDSPNSSFYAAIDAAIQAGEV